MIQKPDARFVKLTMGRDMLDDDEIEERVILIERDWKEHKFRKGEYFDQFLGRLLERYDLSISEYHYGSQLLEEVQ